MSTSDLPPEGSELLTSLEWPAIPQLVRSAVADEGRLAAARSIGLGDGDDEILDRFTRIAAEALHAPKSAITFVDPQRQRFVSRHGFSGRETPIDKSYCQYAVGLRTALAISDATKDPVLKDNPATREGVRSYLGVPMLSSEGHAVGTVCVFGDEPRVWEADDVVLLRRVTAAVAAELELRRSLRRTATGDPKN